MVSNFVVKLCAISSLSFGLFGISSLANAGFVVFENAPVFEGVGFYSDGFDSKGAYNYPQSGAQSFSLEDSTTVGGLSWWGSMNGFFGQGLDNVDCFQIVVWNSTFTNQVYSKRVDISNITISSAGADSFYGQPVYEFSVDSSDVADFNLTSGSYFMNIGAILNDTQGDQFVWSQGEDVDGFWYTNSNNWGNWQPLPSQIENTAGGAFQMYALVPTPGAVALLGMAGLLGRRRNR